ncbi:hypothetical protein Scep_029769 [Stephania cephalantha]|uniref:Uncharacterized protein n=1 Tax=Stephania cephalantha TaxID=152367 RepID=A0AAP0E1N7_9MAGN
MVGPASARRESGGSGDHETQDGGDVVLEGEADGGDGGDGEMEQMVRRRERRCESALAKVFMSWQGRASPSVPYQGWVGHDLAKPKEGLGTIPGQSMW